MADSGLPPPKPLKLEGNVIENWKRWKKEFNYYLAAIEADDKSDKVMSNKLLHCIGHKGSEIYDTLHLQRRWRQHEAR